MITKTEKRVAFALVFALTLVCVVALYSATPVTSKSSPCPPDTSESAFYTDHLRRYSNMVEQGYNRGVHINKFNDKYAYRGAPYCASGLSYVLDELDVSYPFERTAWSRGFINKYSIKAWDVVRGKKELPRDCIAVYIRKGGGHVDFVIRRIGRDSIELFGFNTSPDSDKGRRAWNGKWSGFKRRELRKLCLPTNPYRITHFTQVIR